VREIREILILWTLTMVRVWVPVFHDNLFAGAIWAVASLFYLLYTQYGRWRFIKDRPGAGLSLAYEAGIRRDTFLPSLRFLMPYLLGALLLIGGICFALGASSGCRHFLLTSLLYFLWALVQQYLLQGYIVVRLQSLGKSRWATGFLAGLIFASVHIPNPTLTLTTFIGGWILSCAFLSYPNLFAVAIAHSLIASSMKCFLPPAILPSMYVGIFYLHPPK